MIDLPEPPKCPASLKRWLGQVRTAIRTIRPIQGAYHYISEENDKGTTHSGIPSEGTGSIPVPGTITVTVENVSGYVEDMDQLEVDNVDKLTFDIENFMIFDGGGGQCIVRLRTCPSECPP